MSRPTFREQYEALRALEKGRRVSDAHESCEAELHATWDGEPVDLCCGRELGHPGPHAHGTEWEW